MNPGKGDLGNISLSYGQDVVISGFTFTITSTEYPSDRIFLKCEVGCENGLSLDVDEGTGRRILAILEERLGEIEIKNPLKLYGLLKEVDNDYSNEKA